MATIWAAEGFQFVWTIPTLLTSLNKQLGVVSCAEYTPGNAFLGTGTDPYGVSRQVLRLQSSGIMAVFPENKVTSCVSCYHHNLGIASSSKLFEWYDGTTAQCYVTLALDGSVLYAKAYRGDGTLLGAATVGATHNAWIHWAAKATIDNSTGAITVKMNGTTVLALTNVDTQMSANAYATKVGTRCEYSGSNICDWVLSDDFFSNLVRVVTLSPNADGADVAWTPSAGNRYQCLDDLPANSSDYISSLTAAQENGCKYPAPGVAGNYLAVIHQVAAAKSDIDVRQIKLMIRAQDTSKAYGSVETLGAGYDLFSVMRTVSPDDSQPFDASDFGASGAQFGVRMEA